MGRPVANARPAMASPTDSRPFAYIAAKRRPARHLRKQRCASKGMLENQRTKNRIWRMRSSQGGKIASSCTCHNGMVTRNRYAWLAKILAPVTRRISIAILGRVQASESREACRAEKRSEERRVG